MAAVSSGNLLHYFGWTMVNYGVLPFLLAVQILILVLWLVRAERRQIAAA